VISWTVPTNGEFVTASFSSHTAQSTKLTRSFSTTESGGYFDGTLFVTTTSSQSESGSVRQATITSLNESGTFRTTQISVAGAFTSASGVTLDHQFSEESDNFVLTDGTSTVTVETAPATILTASTAPFYLSLPVRTSTTLTSEGSNFEATLRSSLDYPEDAESVSESYNIVAATTVLNSVSLPTTSYSPTTYWFYRSEEVEVTYDTTTELASSATFEREATIYQAEANEVIYSITNWPTFVYPPAAARPSATTATRVTVLPISNPVTRNSIAVTATSLATTAVEVPLVTTLSSTLTLLGPDGYNETALHEFPNITTTTGVLSFDYQFESSTQITGSYEDGSRTEADTLFNQTVVALQAESYAADIWQPAIVVGGPPGTSQFRFGKSNWKIAGQKGAETTPEDFHLDLSPYSGSFTRGQRTFRNATQSAFTLQAPSITYRTTVGAAPTTSSTIIGVSGPPALISDDAAAIEHLGGGEYAESWTVVDRVGADLVYDDMVNQGTTQFDGNDTSYQQEDIVAVSHLTKAPYLVGGAPAPGNPAAIIWTEHRNPPLEAL